MIYCHKIHEESIETQISFFKRNSRITDYHVILSVSNPFLTYEEQLDMIQIAYTSLWEKYIDSEAIAVFRRYFISDGINQVEQLILNDRKNTFCALSIVEQPPLNGSKIALWAWLQTNIETKVLSDGMFEACRNGYRQFWIGNICNRAINVEYQMRLIWKDYILKLTAVDCTLASNCIRTWLFTRDIDKDYRDIVKARKDIFSVQNLTDQTHYISSTGIAGKHSDPTVYVKMDAYAIEGINANQIQYLYAPEYLNSPYEYGVTFERGVSIQHEDYQLIFISGTASIDNRGEILYKGSVIKQMRQIKENITALLREANSNVQDIIQSLIYIRDIADYQNLKSFIDENYPSLPYIILHAALCRTDGLVEMECIAMRGTNK